MGRHLGQRGMTLVETLVASTIFLLILGGVFSIFRETLLRGPHRIMFEASSKRLQVGMTKIVDGLESSNSQGVGLVRLADDNSILSIQRKTGIDSLGSVTWEEELHLYWNEKKEETLRYARVKKDEAAARGLELSPNFPQRPTTDQLKALVSDKIKRSKVMVGDVTEFRVSDAWLTEDEKTVDIVLRMENPRMREQRFQVERSVWLERP